MHALRTRPLLGPLKKPFTACVKSKIIRSFHAKVFINNSRVKGLSIQIIFELETFNLKSPITVKFIILENVVLYSTCNIYFLVFE